MKRKIAVILGSMAAVGIVLGALIVLRFMLYGGGGSEWPDYFSADQLVNDSDGITIARYLDETTYVVPIVSAADGLPHGSVTEIVRRFGVIESLKGEIRDGETIYVGYPTTAPLWSDINSCTVSGHQFTCSYDLSYTPVGSILSEVSIAVFPLDGEYGGGDYGGEGKRGRRLIISIGPFEFQ